jgi:TPR repeat protein/S1-C subfamily serine protease
VVDVILVGQGHTNLAKRQWRSKQSFLLAVLLFAPYVLSSQSPPPPQPPNLSRPAGSAGEMSAEDVFKRLASRILFLTCEESADEHALASGVLVSADGFIVTNAHVVQKCRSMSATFINGASRRFYEPVLKYYDEQSDTAVLKIPAEGLDFFDVLARPVRIGERVYAIGNPRGLEQSISEGIVSGNREQDGVPWIQHSAPISPGSSGGALISSRGELLGINAWTRTESQNLNFAVPAATLVRALSGARTLTGFLDFPPNAVLTGTYSGVVLQLAAGVSADFTIVVAESRGTLQGCMVVKPPLVGSGYLRGTTHGSKFSFVVASDSARMSFDGQRAAVNLAGAYSESMPDGGPGPNGTFTLRRISADGPGSGFNVQSCPNDATVAREAAEQGDASAQLILGFLYYGGRGVPQDYPQAILWIRKAALQGNAEAQASLGMAYEMGTGVQQDAVQAVAWYREAAEHGNAGRVPIAWIQNQLGLLYATGKGVTRDDFEAAKWFRKAAERGNASAQLNLGAAYLYGVGVPEDYGESYFWVKLASTGEASGAKPEEIGALLGVIASHLTPAAVSQAQERARGWLAAHATRAR